MHDCELSPATVVGAGIIMHLVNILRRVPLKLVDPHFINIPLSVMMHRNDIP